MGKSKALTKSTASGFSLDYSCALCVRKSRSKARVQIREKEGSR